ncbi:origin recognition complex subunit 4 C-terminus-domain-containing protein [Durotheca rogersii]|uniref:origin recognition complex subunit 4 C-terminus-domain-containing protein n=1 Tax=Durotheca rogersii TaxID=419775 RepID=UPI00222035DE|nr:origin recognition complex subunit 4 C-terminus-domain-containing protein [Durotheca rogersii]KAI5868287.1 origin recognition complex subunit 4 C-terminus-domain-containing protein [Durotheca rogersii]
MATNKTPDQAKLGSARRKRARLQDEPDSSPIASPSIAATAKRRRLNGLASINSSPSTPKGLSAISTAHRNALRSTKPTTAKSASHPQSAQTKPIGKDDAYDVPGSSSADELEIKKLQSLPIKHKKLGIRPPSKKARPSTGSFDKSASKARGSKGEADNSQGQTAGGQANIQPTPSGRNGPAAMPVASSRKSVSERLLESRKTPKQVELVEDETSQKATPKRKGRPPNALATRADANRSPVAKTTSLKGILTPKKRNAGRPRKTVAFNEGGLEKENEVFFEDIPPEDADSELQKAVGAGIDDGSPEEEGAGTGEYEDDEVCAICSKPDSEPPNEIVFCENCNMAVHQKCYNIPVIPDDDWFCRSCSQDDVLLGAKTTPKKQTGVAKSPEIPSIPNLEEHLRRTQRVLLDRCSGNRRIKLRGQTEAYDKTFQLVEQTVLAGEGNSMMIIGARGCGKTTLIEEVISNLKADHQDEFHVVRLNGFIHTDDKLALKEIWRQLGKEMDLEDELVNKTSNYADTMASLLALLSHPAEIMGAEDGVTSKSVVFIIDEFDLFATHARQTLLYNLFDVAQARKAPIAVLGLTTRIDVVESLEKRVKSRFSHRYVYMSLPKTLAAYWDVCKQGLSVDEEDLESEGFDTDLEGFYEFRDYWDKKIEALRKTQKFEDHLEFHYYTTKSVPGFLTSCILPLSVLSASSLDLSIPSSSSAGCVSLEPPGSKLHLIEALSDLELSLLISAARLDIIAHTDTVNFAMAYDEYSSQMGKQRVQSTASGMLALGAGARTWGRAVAAVAWERLVLLGLLLPAGVGGRSSAVHGGLEGKMWKLEVALEEIPAARELPGFLARWCSQI